MRNTVEYAQRAAKQLRKLPVADSKAVRAHCDGLVDMPACRNVKALVNHRCQYRLRVGRYRVFFNFDDTVRVVRIEEVNKRDEHTYERRANYPRCRG